MKALVAALLLSAMALQGCSRDTESNMKKLGGDTKNLINSAARDLDSKFK